MALYINWMFLRRALRTHELQSTVLCCFVRGERSFQRSLRRQIVWSNRQSVRLSSHASKSETRYQSNDEGIEGVRKGRKNKDPEDEFMNLWQATESHLRDRIRTNIRGTKDKVEVKGRRQRSMGSVKGTILLPGESEMNREEEDQLSNDNDDYSYRIPVKRTLGGYPVEEETQDNQVTDQSLDIHHESVPIGSSFADMGVHPKLIVKLNKYGIINPVPIQERALPLVYKHKSVLIKSETGSGKSLVFLLPTVQDPGRGCGTVIVVPTRELASQMLYEVYKLLGDKSIVASFVSGVDLTRQEKRLQDPVHPPRIVIGTPKRLLEVVQKHESLFHKTKRIVIDEVDKTLLPLPHRATQKKITSRLMHPRPGRLLVEKLTKISKVKQIQLIGATATVSDALSEDLVDLGWGDHVTVIQPLSFKGRYRSVPECITHRYTIYDEKLVTSKAQVLARLYEASKQTSALVFIHRKYSVDEFVWELRYLGLNAVALYKQVATQDPLKYRMFLSDFRSGDIQLVVGTEETVRGLDFKDLDHVYLMEVPKTAEEYLHLAGRVGRQGRPGTATTVVSAAVAGEDRRIRLQYRRLGVQFRQI